jgi:hypothetical protein
MNWLDYLIMTAFLVAICAVGGLFRTKRATPAST